MDAISCRAKPVEQQAAQIDLAAAGADSDDIAARGRNARVAVPLDADGLGDCESPVAGGIQYVDLATSRHDIVGMLEGATRGCESASIGVRALRSDEHSSRRRLRRPK